MRCSVNSEPMNTTVSSLTSWNGTPGSSVGAGSAEWTDEAAMRMRIAARSQVCLGMPVGYARDMPEASRCLKCYEEPRRLRKGGPWRSSRRGSSFATRDSGVSGDAELVSPATIVPPPFFSERIQVDEREDHPAISSWGTEPFGIEGILGFLLSMEWVEARPVFLILAVRDIR